MEIDSSPQPVRAPGQSQLEAPPAVPQFEFAEVDRGREFPMGPGAEMLVKAITEMQEAVAVPFVEGGTRLGEIDVLSEPAIALATSITVNSSVDSSSFTATEPIHVDPSSSADAFASVWDIATNQILQSVASDDTQMLVTNNAPERLVDIENLYHDTLTQRPTEERSHIGQHVSRLLRELHSPSTRSIETDELSLPHSNEVPVPPDEDSSNEGGMVLLQAAQRTAGSELFLVDEAFAEFADLFDVNVRMESSIGAYQAFDVESPTRTSGQDPIRPASSSKPGSGRSAEDAATKLSPSTARVATPAVSGVVASAVAAASLRRSWRHKQTTPKI